jgi:hypothetical protein
VGSLLNLPHSLQGLGLHQPSRNVLVIERQQTLQGLQRKNVLLQPDLRLRFAKTPGNNARPAYSEPLESYVDLHKVLLGIFEIQVEDRVGQLAILAFDPQAI